MQCDAVPTCAFEPVAYRDRNVIERMFCTLKDWRRIPTTYDKLARNFASVVAVVATSIWWTYLSLHFIGAARNVAVRHSILVPTVSSERRELIPADLKPSIAVSTNQAFALYDAPLWNMALIASRMHLVWIGTVCGKLKTDYRYSNTLGWNTFPVPTLTEKNKADLTRCAEDILLARAAHFPATIADLYDPDAMPADLREAHERNDEVLERIYIGRRFRNDTEQLEKLFELYTKMTVGAGAGKKRKAGAA